MGWDLEIREVYGTEGSLDLRVTSCVLRLK